MPAAIKRHSPNRKSNIREVKPQTEFLEFEVNPLISDIVLWNDADLLRDRIEFRALPKALRVARICEGLFSRGVAFVDFQPTAVWFPFREIEMKCGGSSIVAPSKYSLDLNLSLDRESKALEKAIRMQFRKNLDSIVARSVAGFSACNNGLTAVDGVYDVGMLRWRLKNSG